MTRPTATTTPHGATRERILDVAQQLVQTESYDGFSFRDVAQAVGIRKASVYHHFESKEALAAAMVERAAERFQEWSLGYRGAAPMARLRAYCFDLYGGHLCAGERLCPGGSLVAGWSHLSGEVHQSVRMLIDYQQAFLEEAIGDGAVDGTLRLPAGRDVPATARWVASAVQGALVCARAAGSRDEFDALCRTTLDLLEAGASRCG